MLQIKNFYYKIRKKCTAHCSFHSIIKCMFSLSVICIFYYLLLQTIQLTNRVTSNTLFEQITISEATDDVHASSDTSTSKKGIGQLIDINNASKDTLMELPNIGAKKAEDIIVYREHTPFMSIEDLQQVKGIGSKTFEKLSEYITV